MSGASRREVRWATASLVIALAACSMRASPAPAPAAAPAEPTSPPAEPASATAGAYTWRNVQIVGGGFVPGIVFNVTEPGLVYARTDIGGAYRWDPTTESWIPLLDWAGGDDWSLTGVDSLATDPIDPDRLYVLAGTYTNGWDPRNGAILRSTDGGATFTRLPGVERADNIGLGKAASGQSYMALYTSGQVGGVRGIHRSIDAGATWERVNDDQHQYGSTNAAITGDPRVFGRVYVATNGRGIVYGEPGR